MVAEQTLVVRKRLVEVDEAWKFDIYEESGGYEAARNVVTSMSPEATLELVKASGLRGRGGAGFPTGMKWSFVPKDVFPKYLVVNHDEGEPGTFKDRELLESDPHQLLEGMIIAAFAVGASKAFIYCRGEFALGSRRIVQAIRSAYDNGYLGEGVFGSSFDFDIVLHRGAGAYICGEESALLDSLEGHRGQPRLKPPFPAVKGLYGQPTVVNNTETLSTLPHILNHGVDWFRQWGTEKSPGVKIFSVSGHVNAPGNYEVPLGTNLGDILELAGGMLNDSDLKAVIPGGISAPLLTTTDIAMDFEELQGAGTMLGSGGVVFMDHTTCMVRNALVAAQFYEHESCGKCTPCREGTWWQVKVLERIEHGEGRQEDLDLLLDMCERMDGRCFCPLGDTAAWAVRSNIKSFRSDFEDHVAAGHCTYETDHRTLVGARASGAGATGLGDAGVTPQPSAGIGSDHDGHAR
ncbi:MAG: NADH-quinone oxidoreductase subunit NuoF [Actinomycetota bacterium]|nr:NADH-quinone oxidoreductase subunit NuoF [Actinomycetota bacterium]